MKTQKHYWLSLIWILLNLTATAQTKYNLKEMQRETLGRGVVAIRENQHQVALSWRYLSSDDERTGFNIYRDGKKIAHVPAGTGTFYKDSLSSERTATYTVKPAHRKRRTHSPEGSYTLPAYAPEGYLSIPLEAPQNGTTPAGENYYYTPNDASIGDVDGDGNYEIILKWDPTNAHDNAHNGYTGNVYFDCYRLTGERLWRIDLGKNIRAGAHYTPFMVYDLDGDNCVEIIMKTADGATDGTGRVIGNAEADHRNEAGRILQGKEYLTVFEGRTGKALQTIGYIPERGDIKDWGDSYGNRCDRFLACVAYLNGKHPSVILCRGYYTRTVLAAFDWDGKSLTHRWTFDSNETGHEHYAGQGNHNLRIADVDKDGCDEIIYGSCTIDHNGKGLYSTGMGHGDALHLTQFSPSDSTLLIWACHENRKDGSSMRDAATGKVIWQLPSKKDVGRCMAADIDPTHPGVEVWSSESDGLRSYTGDPIASKVPGLTCNMAIWWDGDLSRELLDKNTISKYQPETQRCIPIITFSGCSSNNGTKATPALQADMIGDWREEVLFRTADNKELRLYISTIPTPYRLHTFLEDPVYRISIATQNSGYNQPTQPGFYIGSDLKGKFRGYDFGKNK